MKISDIQRYDSKKMYEAYDYWPKSAKEHYEKDFSKLEIDNVDHIVFAGMGGSGTIGDIISSILSNIDSAANEMVTNISAAIPNAFQVSACLNTPKSAC